MPPPPSPPAPLPGRAPARGARLRELATVFLRLGATAFGGPAAHVALMEDELVVRRRWLTRDAFLDLVAAAHLVPGPTSTELALHLGLVRGGWPGLVVAGACFILPAALLVGALAAGYARYGVVPAVGAVTSGLAPAVLAVVGQALWRLGRASITTRARGALAATCVAGVALGAHPLALLLAAGAAAAAAGGRRPANVLAAPLLVGPGGAAGALGAGVAAAGAGAAVSLGGLFLTSFKIGAAVVGSGYVLIAFLRADLVERLGWLTERQLVDAIVVGQVTPGPLFTTATFVGYLLLGVPGAAIATVGVFLPAFGFVALSGVLLPWLRRHAAPRAFLDGVGVASLAWMAVSTVQLAGATLVDGEAAAVAAVAGGALALGGRPAWVLLGGALAGAARAWA